MRADLHSAPTFGCHSEAKPRNLRFLTPRSLKAAAAPILLALALTTTARAQQQPWPTYGGSSYQDRYSPLTQITPQNITKLEKVWTYEAGKEGSLQTNPLIIDRTLYGYTPTQQVFALDAATGRKLWTFDAGTPGLQPSRGLSWWQDPHGKHSILFAGVLSFLYALDPATGKPLPSFGENGRVDLRKDLGEPDWQHSFAAMTTPGTVFQDLIIVGFRLPEQKPALHGDIRAYDVHSGRIRWIFHTIPHPGEPGYDTWPPDAWKTSGSANNWTGMALDPVRGIVYIPTGSAVDDFFGGDRLGNDLYADTLLALDAATGKLLWHFQGVHHDIWDRDFPSPPTLLTVTSHGKRVDAVAQTTKQGFVYLFDRVTGQPLFPVEEHPYPPSTTPGERTSPTQPLPTKPAPFARQRLTEDLLTTRTPAAHAWAVEQFETFRSAGQFVPFSVDQPTVVFPGFDGGAEWGGSAADPRTGVLYVNSNDLAWTGAIAPATTSGNLGQDVYQSQCSMCHGANRQGAPPAFPSLLGVDQRYSGAEITAILHNGKGRMPAFPNVADARLAALLTYLKSDSTAGAPPARSSVGTVTLPNSQSPNPSESAGQHLYQLHCALCHGEHLQGEPSNYPGLVGERTRLTDAQILAQIHNGEGRMPGFPNLSEADTHAILRYLGPPLAPDASSKEEAQSTQAPAAQSPYRFTGYRKFLDPDGYPAVQPPWGTLSAIDLNTGEYLWHIPLGNYPELAAQGFPAPGTDTGTENYGGPILTASGLVFIAATNFDHTLRAFDSKTGQLLWHADLPYAGNATPATYMVDGKQYLVIASSNARNPKAPQGAAWVAFALP